MSNRRSQALLLFFSLIGITSSLPARESQTAFSTTIEEFCRLAPPDRKALVAKALERRLEHGNNIHYAALMLGNVSEYHDGRVGKVLVELNGSHFRHWRFGKSFRMDTDRGGVDVSNSVQFMVAGFDSERGIS